MLIMMLMLMLASILLIQLNKDLMPWFTARCQYFFQYFGFYVEFAKLVLRLCTVFQNRAGGRASQLDKTFC